MRNIHSWKMMKAVSKTLKLIRYIFPLFLLIGTLQAQNITQVEYFFDSDPGLGAGTVVSVTPSPHITNLNFNISSTGLTPGFHHLYVRARDENGHWSITSERILYKMTAGSSTPLVNKTEYYIDTDPGFGLGTDVPVTPGVNISNLTFQVDVSGLTQGFHKIFVRSRDSAGHWSLTTNGLFYKYVIDNTLFNIVKVEYFIDTDPGFGLGTNVPVTPGTNLTGIVFDADITTLSHGFHTIWVRARDAQGKWSLCKYSSFYKMAANNVLADMVKVECFIDNDPGIGAGIDIPVTPGTNLNNVAFSIDIAGLTPGFHNLHLRAKDADGRWSLTQSKAFLKMVASDTALSDITKAEYFLDTDPGFGMAVNIPVTPGANLSNVSFAIDISGLNQGFHSVYVRAKDENGKWSLTHSLPFYKGRFSDVMANIVKAEYFIDTDPGFGHGANIPLNPATSIDTIHYNIDVTGLTIGFHKLYVRTKDANNIWSLTIFLPFYKQEYLPSVADIVKAEYFLDTDPGNGNGHDIPLTPAPNLTGLPFFVDVTGLTPGMHKLYTRAKDSNGKWSLTNLNTVYYLIDSLPSAAIIGPSAFCINTTAEFTVSLTGIPPWTLTYYDGEDTITATDIQTSIYTFFVNATWSGDHTALILAVSDSGYVGTNTGVPWDYYVYPMPDAAQVITGDQEVCQGTWHVYTTPAIGNTSWYEWTLPPGASYWWYNYYTNSISVYFSGTAVSGVIKVRGVNNCGYGVYSAEFPVTVHTNPLVEASSGVTLIAGDSTQLHANAIGGEPPYAYSWSPDLFLDDATSANPWCTPAYSVYYSVYVTDANGCVGGNNLTVTVIPFDSVNLSGKVTYHNTALTPLGNTSVFLIQGSDTVRSTLTDAGGNYAFYGLTHGNYAVRARSPLPWGGGNATDALLIMRHFVNMQLQTGLPLKACNLDNQPAVNSIDALIDMRRFVSMIHSFYVGDWAWDDPSVDLPYTGDISQNFQGMCYGDINGDYQILKSGPPFSLEASGTILTNNGEAEIPLVASRDVSLGAASLVLKYQAGVEVIEVIMPSAGDNFVYEAANGMLRLAWYDLASLPLKAGDVLLKIRVRLNDLQQLPENGVLFTSTSESEIADPSGIVIPDPGLVVPRLVHAGPGAGPVISNYPNPFSGRTTFEYTLDRPGKVTLGIFNALGELVSTPVSDQTLDAGNYKLAFPAGNLTPGVYWYKFVVDQGPGPVFKTGKIVIQ